MKLNMEDNIITSNIEAESVSFKMNASPIAYKILSDGLYKNKIGSIIRELISNAYDSQKEAENDVPIYVQLPSLLDQQFIIRDYGTGLSDEQMKKIYTTYFLSTKSSDNKYIGGFGLGSKTPLCYNKEQFGVCSYYNGYKTSYLVYMDNGIPTLQEMFKEKTTEHNGLEISIGVDKNDMESFARELYEFSKWIPFQLNVVNNKYSYDYSTRIEKYHVVKNVYLSSIRSYTHSIFVLINGIPYSVLLKDLFNDTYENIVIKNIESIKKYIFEYCKLKIDDKMIINRFSKMYDIETLAYYDYNVIFDLPIGTIDLTASRESVSYTEKTKQEITSRFLALLFTSEYYPLKLFNENGWKENPDKEMDEKDYEIYKKYSKLMTICPMEIFHKYSDFNIPVFTFGSIYNYIESFFYDDGKWKYNYKTSYPDYLLPCSTGGVEGEISYIKVNKQDYRTFYTIADKSSLGYISKNKQINVILSNVHIDTYIKKHNIEDGYYVYIRSKSKDILNKYEKKLKEDPFTKFNIKSFQTTKITVSNKRKCAYAAFICSEFSVNDLSYDKTDIIASAHDDGMDVFYLPCHCDARKLSQYEKENLVHLANSCLRKLKSKEKRIIVIIDVSRKQAFEKYYPYANIILENKNFQKTVKHIFYFGISLVGIMNIKAFIDKDYAHTNSRKLNNMKLFNKYWMSFKKYVDKNSVFCQWLDNISSNCNWNYLIERSYCDIWKVYMPYLRYEYRFKSDDKVPTKFLKKKALLNYCLDVLTYNNVYDTVHNEFFANIIRKGFNK